MLRTGLAVWLAVVVGGAATTAAQAPAPPGELSAAMRTHVRSERFQIVTSVRGLPLGVRDALQALFGSPVLDIAEPGTPFQVTDNIVTPRLPIRRLVSAGCSSDHCLVYYERGGIAHTWQVALFHWTPSGTRLDAGGIASGGLASVDAVRDALLSGAIKSPNKFW